MMTVDEVWLQVQDFSEEAKQQLLARIILDLGYQAPSEDWVSFVESTYGSLVNDPIERAPQGDFEVRDFLE